MLRSALNDFVFHRTFSVVQVIPDDRETGCP